MNENQGAIKLPVEAFDYVQLAFQKYHNHQLHCLLTLDGQIQEKVLEIAVIKSFEDLPQLSAVFESGEWIHKKDKLPFKIELLYQEHFTHDDMEKLFAKTEVIKQEYQIRVVIIQEKVRDHIAVIMNHMLVDGMDMKRYLYLLCGLYNEILTGEKTEPRYIGKSRTVSWVAHKKTAKRPSSSKKAKKQEKLSLEAGDIPVFIMEKVSKEQFLKLVIRTKELKVTINEFLMAVYYKAIEKTFGYEMTTLCCAIDLRRYVQDKDSLGLCNQTGNLFCNIKKQQELTIEQLAQEIHKQMQDEKEKGYCLGQTKLLNRVFSLFSHKHSMYLIEKSISNPEIAFTNLGVIDEQRLSFNGIETTDCFLTGSLKQVPNFQVAASTYREELTLGINMVVSGNEKKQLKTFLQKYCAILKEYCDK